MTKSFAAAALLAASLFLQPAAAQDVKDASASPHPYDKIGIGFGDIADAATTSWGLNTGLAEGNPLMRPFAGSAPFLGPLVEKYLLKQAMVQGAGLRPAKANVLMDALGWGGACANIVTITGGEPLTSVVAMGGCMVSAYRLRQDIYLADTGMTLEGRKASPQSRTQALERLGRQSAGAEQGHRYDSAEHRFHDGRSGKDWIVKNPANGPYSIAQLIAAVDKLEAAQD